ncbi:MAG: TrkH family potassium uptake protein [Microthrixaceae bacterium]|nr:TrkH family potassium uptake protein [Microthrixaceae bacterium]
MMTGRPGIRTVAPSAPASRRRGVPSIWLHMAGLSMLFVGAGMILCAVVDLAAGGDAAGALMASAGITAAVGELCRRNSRIPDDIRPANVFVAVTMSWLATSAAGALPFLTSGLIDRVDNALFESISGFTCTGSTVLSSADFDAASPGVLFWRQLSQWFGGMGIIVLAIAVLPFLGVGGLGLIRAEAPGPTSDRLAPRVKETAKRLWLVYVGFTVLSIVALMATGIGWFDSAGLAAALVSTGGFAPKAASVGAYDSVIVEVILIVGMIYGGASFTLHYNALRGRVGVYARNSEFRAYLAAIALGIAAVTAILVHDGFRPAGALRAAAFNVVTLATSCGFGNATYAGSPGDFTVWAPAAQVILLLFMWVGGMTGSTSGGIKVMRAQVMARVAWREVIRASLPKVVRPIKQGSEPLDEPVVTRIGGFVMLYFLMVIVSALLVTLAGTDVTSGLSGAVSAMGNMGPALGEAGPTSNFLIYSAPERAVFGLLMLIGRLEVFPMTLAVVVAAQRLRSTLRARLPR